MYLLIFMNQNEIHNIISRQSSDNYMSEKGKEIKTLDNRTKYKSSKIED